MVPVVRLIAVASWVALATCAAPHPPPPAPVASATEVVKPAGGGVQAVVEPADGGPEARFDSKSWRFSTFYNRVKRQVEDRWHPERIYRSVDGGGAFADGKDRLTVLRVRLAPHGEIREVAIDKSSGIAALDDEAMRAMKDAQPFMNPPRQLVESDELTFWFGFLFDLTSARSQVQDLGTSHPDAGAGR